MKRKSPLKKTPTAFIAGTLLAATLFSLPGDTFAFQRGEKRPPERSVPYRGRVVNRLPPDHRDFEIGKHRYFYHGGTYYRRGPSGFVVVSAPLGAIIVDLPIGFRTAVIGGGTYYWYGGVYYKRVPSGYRVVEAPLRVEQATAEGAQVSVTTDLLNVRSGPGMNHSVIARVPQGVVLVVHGNAPGWLYVELPDFRFGWVVSEFTAPLLPTPSG